MGRHSFFNCCRHYSVNLYLFLTYGCCKIIMVIKIIFSSLAAISLQLSVFSQQPAYKNKSLNPEQRAKDLLKRMTLDEKVMQTQCLWGNKSLILTNGDFDPAKAANVLKNGLGELARLNENAGQNSMGFHPKQAA